MRNKYVQISLMDTYTGVLEAMETNKSELVRLLEEYIDFEAIIPPDFYIAYKNHMGRKQGRTGRIAGGPLVGSAAGASGCRPGSPARACRRSLGVNVHQ